MGIHMEKSWKHRAGQAALSLAIAGLMTLLSGLGVMASLDLAVSDALYQSRRATDGEIVLVGIDQRALEEIGPYGQWGREIFAYAIDALNASEDCRPAVIGLDVLFTGALDPQGDALLAEAVGRYSNVITASAAQFGDALGTDSAGREMVDSFAVTEWYQPYEALRAVTSQGHINAMGDADGILRHQLLYIQLPDGSRTPSLSLLAAEKYRQYHNQPSPKLPPVSSRGFWYLPFCGQPGDFDESISIADLISGTIPADYFAGKIVLIGPYTPGLQDRYLTAADHARQMYGVEYQANAIQALLWEEYKLEAPEGLQELLLFIILLLAILGFWKRSVRFTTALWALVSGGWLAFCKIAYHFGSIFHPLWVPVGVSLLYVGCLAFNYLTAAVERRRVTSTFQRYVAPEIVRELLKDDSALELGGKLVDIAVLFVDVRGFTPMSELLTPVQVVEILNRYLSLISSCIMKNGGTLDKFVGDAAMAIWGAPLPQEDYIMHAVQAAMDMVSGSAALSQELREKYGRTVSFGIGVHVGEAVVGNIGSPQRMDYTAIGDTVNTAARLEANAPGGTVYISRAVADALQGRIKTTSLGDSVKLKGKKEGFEVLTLDEIL